MKRILFLLVGSLFLTNLANALPPRQHLAKGTVATVGPDAIVFTVPATAPTDAPTSFAIKAGRTRFRENGKNASLEKLKVGQSVRLYYRKELGTWVATEVAWKTAPP